jgi:hypothetical protein
MGADRIQRHQPLCSRDDLCVSRRVTDQLWPYQRCYDRLKTAVVSILSDTVDDRHPYSLKKELRKSRRLSVCKFLRQSTTWL